MVAKGGPKLTESGPDEPPPEAPRGDRPFGSPGTAMGGDGFPETPPGRSAGPAINGKMTSRVVSGSMAGLAAMLSSQSGRPVIDKTGLTGRYDYVLKFVMRTGVPPPAPGADGAIPAAPEGPSIVSAIQEQLGLRLKSSRGIDS